MTTPPVEVEHSEQNCPGEEGMDNGCVDGRWYSRCDAEKCYGLCEWTGTCPCSCHNDEEEE